MGGLRLNIRTFPDAIKEYLLFPLIFYMKNFVSRPPKLLLQNFNGFVKPGEMCFVLGRPNAGCSTFLKVIANQRIGFMDVGGNVEYGGIDAKTMGKLYKGESVALLLLLVHANCRLILITFSHRVVYNPQVFRLIF
jgi:hypothetical protein